MKQFRFYAGKYQNHFENRFRWFIVPNADEIPASAFSIKSVYGCNIKNAFINYRRA